MELLRVLKLQAMSQIL